jgi:hypothetical protein
LNQRKEWYEKNQGSLKPEEKEEYANFTDEVLFRMSILEKRLASALRLSLFVKFYRSK